MVEEVEELALNVSDGSLLVDEQVNVLRSSVRVLPLLQLQRNRQLLLSQFKQLQVRILFLQFNRVGDLGQLGRVVGLCELNDLDEVVVHSVRQLPVLPDAIVLLVEVEGEESGGVVEVQKLRVLPQHLQDHLDRLGEVVNDRNDLVLFQGGQAMQSEIENRLRLRL